MKKIWLATLAMAAMLAAPPFAMAETFSFDFVSQNGSFVALGTLQAASSATAGVWNITSMTGTFTDTDHGLAIIDQPINVYPDGTTPESLPTVQGTIMGYSTADGAEVYDNLLYYPTGNYYDGGYYPLDGGGLVFYTGALDGSGYEVSIALGENAQSPEAGWVNVTGRNPSSCSALLYSANGGGEVCFVDYGTNINNGVPLNEYLNPDAPANSGGGAITPAPEPGSLPLLLIGWLALAFGILARREMRVLLATRCRQN